MTTSSTPLTTPTDTPAASAGHFGWPRTKDGSLLDQAAPLPPRPPLQRSGPLTAPQWQELAGLGLPELRALRREAQREEADLSYLRRLFQGRIDILQAELAGRAHPAAGGTAVPAPTQAETGWPAPVPGAQPVEGSPTERREEAEGRAGDRLVVEQLSEILADEPSRVRSSARHVTMGTPRGEEYRQLAQEMLAEVALSDPKALTDGELRAAMDRLGGYERQVSRHRQRLQRTADDCSAEIARRYREGEARIDDLLG
ncbi:RsiG family protein [Streptomyces sp. TP-A0874]|uniref:RsiG family protein n=1 Tax=Streptomyces sp. TP-A0874 TaxID=549819 RepID=UPI000A4429E1|nr:hypothetical protein [Streptomyces sp. TP-A0874]